jgi:hypothetical protein
MTEFSGRVIEQDRTIHTEIEIWEDGRLIGMIYPAEHGLVIVSNHSQESSAVTVLFWDGTRRQE